MRRLAAILVIVGMAATGCSSSKGSGPTPATTASAATSANAAAIDTSINESPVDGSDTATVKTVSVEKQPAAQVPDTKTENYKLKTVFRGDDECLEGNRIDGNSVLAGAAFQDACQNVTGQQWTFSKRSDGYYTMRTQFLGQDKCLEGNQLAGSALGGAAFLDTCKEVTGQQWKLVKAGDNLYRLQTKFREKDDECLEGNRFAPSSVLKGASFMDKCQNVTGQLWYFTAIPA